MMIAGIALHRYRLRHGDWPMDLGQLVPELMRRLPIDYMDGEALRYRTNDTGGFVLYSVGKDLEDNGGDAAPKTTGNPQVWTGKDWVWPTVATKEEVAAFWERKR
jgi:hypothetical protein